MNATVKSTLAYAERNRRTGEQRRARTRARLIEAAIEVISQRGFEAPVVDDFIVAANISRGSFYNYFDTKEELIEAVADRLRNDMMRTNDAASRIIADPAERLVWGVRRIIRHADAVPQLGLLLISETRRISPLDMILRRGPARDVRACISKGRLPRQNVDLAVDFLIGATREAARAAIAWPRPKGHAEWTALLILRGLGMSGEDAEAVVSRPLAVLEELPEEDA